MATWKRIRMILLALTCCLYFSTGAAFAEDTNPKPKSMGVAALLALDPVPGDALLYAGKSIQGTINLFVGGIAGAVFWTGLIKNARMSAAQRKDWGSLGVGLMMIGGGLFYFPALLWDAIGGIAGTASHNAEIERNKKRSVLETFQPTLAVTNESAIIGAQFRF